MKITPKFAVLLPILASLLLAGCGSDDRSPAVAKSDRVVLAEHENYKDFGDFVIHVNAVTTDQLPVEVARNYGIVRSESRAMLNVVIMKKQTADELVAVSGAVDVATRNLTAQVKDVSLRKITEQDAIYYIGEVAVGDGETLIFDIDVTPENHAQTYSLRFKKQFFTG